MRACSGRPPGQLCKRLALQITQHLDLNDLPTLTPETNVDYKLEVPPAVLAIVVRVPFLISLPRPRTSVDAPMQASSVARKPRGSAVHREQSGLRSTRRSSCAGTWSWVVPLIGSLSDSKAGSEGVVCHARQTARHIESMLVICLVSRSCDTFRLFCPLSNRYLYGSHH